MNQQEELQRYKELIADQREELQRCKELIVDQQEELQRCKELIADQQEELDQYKDHESALLSNYIDLSENQAMQLALYSQQVTQASHSAINIQRAILPSIFKLKALLGDHYIIYRPKDVVSGDFYWLDQSGDKVILAVADCPGHGVPGAFMTLLGHMLLNEIILISKITDPMEILNQLAIAWEKSLKKNKKSLSHFMDIGVISFTPTKGIKTQVTYGGAKLSLYHWQHNKQELQVLRGDRKSIECFIGSQPNVFSFQNQQIDISHGDILFTGSDGLIDQNNIKRKKFGIKRLKNVLINNIQLSQKEQKLALENELDNHMKGTTQRDDILWMGFKLASF